MKKPISYTDLFSWSANGIALMTKVFINRIEIS